MLVWVLAIDTVPDGTTDTEADLMTDEEDDAVVVFEVPGRFGTIGMTEVVVVALRMLEMTVEPVGWAIPDVVLEA